MEGSTLYTIGTALNRAANERQVVHVLVEGEWLSGMVVAVDGHGLVLAPDSTEQTVVRIEAISAVRVTARMVERGHSEDDEQAARAQRSGEARPMPAGRRASHRREDDD